MKALFFLFAFAISLEASAYNQNDLYITCRTLGEVAQCSNVSICRTESDGGQCQATQNALNANPQWAQICHQAGVNQMACGWQFNCRWEERTSCVPN